MKVLRLWTIACAAVLAPAATGGQSLTAAPGPSAAPPTGSSSGARSDPVPRLLDSLPETAADASSFRDRFDAEVWLKVMSGRLAAKVPDAEERLAILEAVHREAIRFRLAPELVLALIDVESNFDRFAISSVSALGLMQVMPFWVDEAGYDDKNQLFEIEHNVRLGCAILRRYIDMENGDMIKALARYNGSIGQRWFADRVLDRLRKKWVLH